MARKGEVRIPRGGRRPGGEENPAGHLVLVEKDKSADAQKLGHHEPYQKTDGGPGVEFLHHGRALSGAGPHHGGLPHGAGDDPGGEDHPDDVRRTESSPLVKRIEPGLSVYRRDGIDDCRPSEPVHGDPAGENDTHGKHDKLDVIGDDNRNHAPEYGIGQNQQEHHGHNQGDRRGIRNAGQARRRRSRPP